LNWFDQFKKRTTQTKQFLHSITHYCGFQESLTLYTTAIFIRLDRQNITTKFISTIDIFHDFAVF